MDGSKVGVAGLTSFKDWLFNLFVCLLACLFVCLFVCLRGFMFVCFAFIELVVGGRKVQSVEARCLAQGLGCRIWTLAFRCLGHQMEDPTRQKMSDGFAERAWNLSLPSNWRTMLFPRPLATLLRESLAGARTPPTPRRCNMFASIQRA